MSATPTMPQPGNETRIVVSIERPLLQRVQLAAFWAVVALACFVAYKLGGQYAEWREVASQHPTRQPLKPSDTAFEAAMMPLAGSWSFDDLDWNINSTTLSRAALASRFETFASSNPGLGADTLPDVSDDVLALVSNLQLSPVERSGNQVYALTRPDIQGQLVTRTVNGRAKVVSLAVATSQGENEWRFYELTPRTIPAKRTHSEDHLLPLPIAASRQGGRFADDGQLLLELVSLETTADALHSAWREAGWEIRHSGFGDPGSFSYLCKRGNEVVYAWSADPAEALKNIMLVRSPAAAELAAQQTAPQL